MNSIEVAQKLIDENNGDIESYRAFEAEIRGHIEELEKEVEYHTRALESIQSSLASEQQRLKRVQDDKFEYLVDNMALKAFVADGGGLDMAVDD